MDVKKLKKRTLFSAVWIVIALLAVTSGTYAWFTFAPRTTVTPMYGTVTGGDGNLLISNSENGSFDVSCELTPVSGTKSLMPLTTGDLTGFFVVSGQAPTGIALKYSTANDRVDSTAVHGYVYLKAEDIAQDICFDGSKLDFGTDGSVLACLRLGLRFTTQSGIKTYIFSLDEMGDTSRAETRLTVPSAGTVVSGIYSGGDPIYISDPARPISAFCASGTEDDLVRGRETLCRLNAEEVAQVEYWLYLEGCDVNCINSVQSRDLALKLGFCGFSEN